LLHLSSSCSKFGKIYPVILHDAVTDNSILMIYSHCYWVTTRLLFTADNQASNGKKYHPDLHHFPLLSERLWEIWLATLKLDLLSQASQGFIPSTFSLIT
jgi:hypothetical protein